MRIHQTLTLADVSMTKRPLGRDLPLVPAGCVRVTLYTRLWFHLPFGLARRAGSIALYVPGLLWLAMFVSMADLLSAGLLPSIPGDIAIPVLAPPFGWKLLARH